MNLPRFKKLLKHMQTGKLGHDLFDFGHFRSDFALENESHKPFLNRRIRCGTMGCMAGELPYLFPSMWRFELRGQDGVRLKRNSEKDPLEDVAVFFDVHLTAARHLFIPRMQHPAEFGGYELESDASRIDVTHNLLLFLTKANSGRVPTEYLSYSTQIQPL